MYKTILSLIFAFSMNHSLANTEIHQEDLSILIPMPGTTILSGAAHYEKLKNVMETEGGYGMLLPRNLRRELPRTFWDSEDDMLKVVGIRLDSCPSNHDGSSECRPEIRIVTQNVFGTTVSGPDGTPFTLYRLYQGSYHISYSVSKEELKQLVLDNKELRREYGFQNADVKLSKTDPHRGILSSNMGEYYEQLLANVFQYVGATRIHRITFSAFRGGGFPDDMEGYDDDMEILDWNFGGILVAEDGTVTDVHIPNIERQIPHRWVRNRVAQTFRLDEINHHHATTDGTVLIPAFDGSIFIPTAKLGSPAVEGIHLSDTINLEVEYDLAFGEHGSEEKQQEFLVRLQDIADRVGYIEDPKRATFHNTDCISCHRAMTVSEDFFLPKKDSSVCSEIDFGSWVSPVENCETNPGSVFGLANFIQFGYDPVESIFAQMITPSISRRTLHETDEVYTQIKRWLTE